MAIGRTENRNLTSIVVKITQHFDIMSLYWYMKKSSKFHFSFRNKSDGDVQNLHGPDNMII